MSDEYDTASEPSPRLPGVEVEQLLRRVHDIVVTMLPGAPLTRDQWLMLQRDNLPAKGASGLEAFGIKPTPLGAVAYDWLGRFHKGGRFAGRRINLTATS